MQPVPVQYPITTAYGKRGSYWSCNEDSNGNGIHTGADFACPEGTPLYATIAGQIRHRNYGSAFGSHQFAISPDAGQPFAEGEVFYAHARKRLSDGVYVKVGDWVGEASDEGNTSGPHLHYEFHPETKNAWNCNVHADPAPTLKDEDPPDPDAGVSSEPGIWKWHSGKETSKVLVYPGDWHKIKIDSQPASGITGKSKEEHFLYLRCHLPTGRSATRTIHTRLIRSDGDETAYLSLSYDASKGNDSIGYPNFHIEDGSGLGGEWQILVEGGTDPIDYTTRYAKTYVTYKDQAAAASAQAVTPELRAEIAKMLLTYLLGGTDASSG
jgi:murein DD-endopeptidase MepM/ murein hydrolase activator NlpD